MEIRYCCTHWGSETLAPTEFLAQLLRDGYSGIEANMSPGKCNDKNLFEQLEELRSHGNFSFIAQMVLDGFGDTPEQHANRMKARLEFLAEFSPDFVNAHTGRDFFSFDENCYVIDAVENHAAKLGIRVLHETHRGRFSFHLPTLLPYLDKFPNLQLTGDFSHFCNVSESMLEGQREMLERIIPHIGHIHARVGWSQSAQVNNPFAPEWHTYLTAFFDWWKSVVEHQKKNGTQLFTITPEAGPFPYMPERPFTREPLAGQWHINVMMKNYLQQYLD